MVDYKLYGMEYVGLKNCLVRGTPQYLTLNCEKSALSPETSCDIEIDVDESDIVNCVDTTYSMINAKCLNIVNHSSRPISPKISQESDCSRKTPLHSDALDEEIQQIKTLLSALSDQQSKPISKNDETSFEFSSLGSLSLSIPPEQEGEDKNEIACGQHQISDLRSLSSLDSNEDDVSATEDAEFVLRMNELSQSFINSSQKPSTPPQFNLNSSHSLDTMKPESLENKLTLTSNSLSSRKYDYYAYIPQPPSKFSVSCFSIRHNLKTSKKSSFSLIGGDVFHPKVKLSNYQHSLDHIKSLINSQSEPSHLKLYTPVVPFPKIPRTNLNVNSNDIQQSIEYSGLMPRIFETTSIGLECENQIIKSEDLKMMSMELVTTCDTSIPNPQRDSIVLCCICVGGCLETSYKIFSVQQLPKTISKVHQMYYADDEVGMIKMLFKEVRESDPDILMGYDCCKLSWGYIIKRSIFLGIPNPTAYLGRLLSSITEISPQSLLPQIFDNNASEYSIPQGLCMHSSSGMAVDYQISGRILFNVWRVVKYEKKMSSYYPASVCQTLFKETLPYFSHSVLLSFLFSQKQQQHNPDQNVFKALDHIKMLCYLNFRIVHKIKVIDRLTQSSRLTGLPLIGSLVRGSQIHVESLLLRFSREAGFVNPSPSRVQVASMRGNEIVQLIVEPRSQIYYDPVLVFDFTSLYPSVMIANNYCYSTCLGRFSSLVEYEPSTQMILGAKYYDPPIKELLKINSDDLHISPCGVVFVKEHIRKGILPRLLKEILAARVSIKKMMKSSKGNKRVTRMLDGYQYGLKLIVNVIYGYTSAGFSGHMPCTELGDSILSKSRETLENAIRLVRSRQSWNAEVIYGDTDSFFVLLPGASRERAFEISKDILQAVNDSNKAPIHLKFEKIYQPFYIQCKKRYSGMKFEDPTQLEPVFEAKGNELIRRGFCGATSKILEKCIRIIFENTSGNVDEKIGKVKNYVLKQCMKITRGDCSISEFLLSKPHRSNIPLRNNNIPPFIKRILSPGTDLNSLPCPGQRICYLVSDGPSTSRLYELIVNPMNLQSTSNLRLNSTYYITRQILGPLSRFMSFLSCDVINWYQELPKTHLDRWNRWLSKGTGQIQQNDLRFFYNISMKRCLRCASVLYGEKKNGIFCYKCSFSENSDVFLLSVMRNDVEYKLVQCRTICSACVGNFSVERELSCKQVICPVFHKRARLTRKISILDDHLHRYNIDDS